MVNDELKIIKEKVKLEKAELSSKKFEGKQKEKKEKKFENLTKRLSKKVVAKSILKKSQATVRIPDYKAPSVLGDPNRFFKKEFEETKRSMFFE
jgi:hypothetical protein